MRDGDFSNPPGAAHDEAHFDPVGSQVVRRTARSTTYENPDGTTTTRLFAGPANFRDVSGTWHEIDTSLEDDGSGGYRSKAGNVRYAFAESTDDPEPVRLEADDWAIGFGLDEAIEGRSASIQQSPDQESSPAAETAVTPQSGAGDESRAVEYSDVRGETDLIYEPGPTGLKETILLSEPPAAEDGARFVFPLSVESASVVSESGGVSFVDSAGDEVAFIPDGVMWDAAHPRAENGVDVDLTSVDGKPAIEVTADWAWLTAADRIYPVQVDPTIIVGTTQDSMVRQSNPTQNYSSLTYGNLQQCCGWGKEMTYINYVLSTIPADEFVIDADWHGHFVDGPSGDPTDYYLRPIHDGWSASNLDWNNRPDVKNTWIRD